MYSVEALERGIEKCKKNIKIFEDAIDKERDTIKEYRQMIDTVERKEHESKQREIIQKQVNEQISKAQTN